MKFICEKDELLKSIDIVSKAINPNNPVDILKGIKIGKWFRIVGNVEMDNYLRQMVLNGRSIEAIKSKDIAVTDDEEEKRVELHAHTFMSQMDGLIHTDKLLKKLKLIKK